MGRRRPDRLERWLAGFAERHGPVEVEGLVHRAADGATAELVPPFRPVSDELAPACGSVSCSCGSAATPRASSRATGRPPRLVSSKVGSRQVHGRSAAGGQSQQRFARRRDNQVTVAYATAADNAVRLLGDERLDAVVTGGERTAVDAVLADRRLARLQPLVVDRLIDVPDPRHRVLLASPALWRAVSIRLLP